MLDLQYLGVIQVQVMQCYKHTSSSLFIMCCMCVCLLWWPEEVSAQNDAELLQQRVTVSLLFAIGSWGLTAECDATMDFYRYGLCPVYLHGAEPYLLTCFSALFCVSWLLFWNILCNDLLQRDRNETVKPCNRAFTSCDCSWIRDIPGKDISHVTVLQPQGENLSFSLHEKVNSVAREHV